MSMGTLEQALTAELAALSKSEENTMPNVEMVTMTRGLRGKGNEGKKVEFQAISEAAARPDNPLEAAVNSVSGDLQAFWDRFVLGYNEYAYEAVADPIAEFIDNSWDGDKVKNFRLTVNAMSKLTGKDKAQVAEELKAVLG